MKPNKYPIHYFYAIKNIILSKEDQKIFYIPNDPMCRYVKYAKNDFTWIFYHRVGNNKFAFNGCILDL
jgi:hypothetical protein